MLYEINEKALKLESEGKKIIRLNLGDPDLATPNEIIEAAYAAMKAGKTKYSSAYGENNLREKLAEFHGVKSENVVITPGSKWGIFATMYLIMKDGGNVIIPTPYWTAYDLNRQKYWGPNQASDELKWKTNGKLTSTSLKASSTKTPR